VPGTLKVLAVKSGLTDSPIKVASYVSQFASGPPIATGGDEVGTYTRGTARLDDGVVRVPLGETFRWVTNPDIGLTAHLTARGDGAVLYVESLTTEELVVRSLDGFPDDIAFDYIVHGLRIGFDDPWNVQSGQGERGTLHSF